MVHNLAGKAGDSEFVNGQSSYTKHVFSIVHKKIDNPSYVYIQ